VGEHTISPQLAIRSTQHMILIATHACYDGVVYVGHLVEDEGGEEVEVAEVMPCRRCKAGAEY
jgi:hypothetical protein